MVHRKAGLIDPLNEADKCQRHEREAGNQQLELEMAEERSVHKKIKGAGISVFYGRPHDIPAAANQSQRL